VGNANYRMQGDTDRAIVTCGGGGVGKGIGVEIRQTKQQSPTKSEAGQAEESRELSVGRRRLH